MLRSSSRLRSSTSSSSIASTSSSCSTLSSVSSSNTFSTPFAHTSPTKPKDRMSTSASASSSNATSSISPTSSRKRKHDKIQKDTTANTLSFRNTRTRKSLSSSISTASISSAFSSNSTLSATFSSAPCMGTSVTNEIPSTATPTPSPSPSPSLNEATIATSTKRSFRSSVAKKLTGRQTRNSAKTTAKELDHTDAHDKSVTSHQGTETLSLSLSPFNSTPSYMPHPSSAVTIASANASTSALASSLSTSTTSTHPWKVGECVFLRSETKGEPYYLGRIMSFTDDAHVRIAWFYRPQDVLSKKTNYPTRMVVASMHSDINPIRSIVEKCSIRHLSEIEDRLTEYLIEKNAFYYHQLFDRFTKKIYDVIPSALLTNRPSAVCKLIQQFPYFFIEEGKNKELKHSYKECRMCHQYVPKEDSLECLTCASVYHSACLSVVRKPKVGYRWQCHFCTVGLPPPSEPSYPEISDDQKKFMRGPSTVMPTEFPFTYFGIHCSNMDAFELDPRHPFYPRLASRISSKYQAIIPAINESSSHATKCKKGLQHTHPPPRNKKRAQLTSSPSLSTSLSTVLSTASPVLAMPLSSVSSTLPPTISKAPLPLSLPTTGLTPDLPAEECSSFRPDRSVEPVLISSIPESAEPEVDRLMAMLKNATSLALPYYSTTLLDRAICEFQQSGHNAQATYDLLTRLSVEDFVNGTTPGRSEPSFHSLGNPYMDQKTLNKFIDAVKEYGFDLNLIHKHALPHLSMPTLVLTLYLHKKSLPILKALHMFFLRHDTHFDLDYTLTKTVPCNPVTLARTRLLNPSSDNIEMEDLSPDSFMDVDPSAQHCLKSFMRHSDDKEISMDINMGINDEDEVSVSENELFEANQCAYCKQISSKYILSNLSLMTIPISASSNSTSATSSAANSLPSSSSLGHTSSTQTALLVHTSSLADNKSSDNPLSLFTVTGIDTLNHASPSTCFVFCQECGQYWLKYGGFPPKSSIILEKCDGQGDGRNENKDIEDEDDVLSDCSSIPSPPFRAQRKKKRPLQLCELCLQPDDLITCSDCGMQVHATCYGIPLASRKWRCVVCFNEKHPIYSMNTHCLLCPSSIQDTWVLTRKQLPLKPTFHFNWVHLLCALFLPMVGFKNFHKLEGVFGIENIPASMYGRPCTLCMHSQGVTLECNHPNCPKLFHISCAFRYGCVFGMQEHASSLSLESTTTSTTASDQKKVPVIWCRAHGLQANQDENALSSTPFDFLAFTEPPVISKTLLEHVIATHVHLRPPSSMTSKDNRRKVSVIKSNPLSLNDFKIKFKLQCEIPKPPMHTSYVCEYCRSDVSLYWFPLEEKLGPLKQWDYLDMLHAHNESERQFQSSSSTFREEEDSVKVCAGPRKCMACYAAGK